MMYLMTELALLHILLGTVSNREPRSMKFKKLSLDTLLLAWKKKRRQTGVGTHHIIAIGDNR
jgi:hypothetical protein